MRKTAQDVIQEALDYQYNESKRDRMSLLDKLFDFSTWGKSYEEKGNSSALMYLTDRLMNEMDARQKAEEQAQSAYKKAMRCVEIYGNDAVQLLNKHWNLV